MNADKKLSENPRDLRETAAIIFQNGRVPANAKIIKNEGDKSDATGPLLQ